MPLTIKKLAYDFSEIALFIDLSVCPSTLLCGSHPFGRANAFSVGTSFLPPPDLPERFCAATAVPYGYCITSM